MIHAIHPLSATAEGLFESEPDNTSVEKFQFFHADKGKPLATPWQVALSRAILLRKYDISTGIIVDCACGSGIQIAAYSEIFQRPVIGVELNPARAQASAVNLRTIFTERGNTSLGRLRDSRVVVGDGRNGREIIEFLSNDLAAEAMPEVAFLHLDPARPRNSRTHSLAEMTPRLDEVFRGWHPHLVNHNNGPAILLDLSPRLSRTQMLEVEALVERFWPSIRKTWTWTSRGQGRIDRLALWVGQIANTMHNRRFIRIPPNPKEPPYELLGGAKIEPVTQANKLSNTMLKRGEYVSLIDAALVESGMANDWLKSPEINLTYHWLIDSGRRPTIYHEKPLELLAPESQYLVQCTGRIADVIPHELNLDTVDTFVDICIKNNLRKVTIRTKLLPELQPMLQGSLDRQLARRGGQKDGVLIRLPSKPTFLLCVV